eukprot:289860-Chlamydomonas_euryale.AAC.5
MSNRGLSPVDKQACEHEREIRERGPSLAAAQRWGGRRTLPRPKPGARRLNPTCQRAVGSAARTGGLDAPVADAAAAAAAPPPRRSALASCSIAALHGCIRGGVHAARCLDPRRAGRWRCAASKVGCHCQRTAWHAPQGVVAVAPCRATATRWSPTRSARRARKALPRSASLRVWCGGGSDEARSRGGACAGAAQRRRCCRSGRVPIGGRPDRAACTLARQQLAQRWCGSKRRQAAQPDVRVRAAPTQRGPTRARRGLSAAVRQTRLQVRARGTFLRCHV